MPFHAVITLMIVVADANSGAKLVAQNGCQACHGAAFRGTAQFPGLYGVEHRLSRAQIVAALTNPKAPMPNYGFSAAQAGDIASYLSGLDGGASADQPVITIAPAHPVNYADVTVRFPGAPPLKVTAVATMAMGSVPMKSPQVIFAPASDPHLYKARITFSMSGSWMIHIVYDGKTIDQPIVIGQ
ncbi:MAG: c-type cytochrome [Candidatus Aquilonibacter sp.]|jgi:cytochrome c553